MDTDVIARLYPLGGQDLTRKIRESSHCELVPPPPSALGSNELWQYALVLRFSRPPRGDRGFVFGHDSGVCDCVLPAFYGVEGAHFAITYDGFHRLVLEDSSTAGTSVEYDGEAGERRRRFIWIIGEDEFTVGKRIIVNASSASFQVVVPEYAHPTTAYDESRAFMAANRTALGPPPRGLEPLFVKTWLGEGTFGWVKRFWDVTTGSSHAVKTAKPWTSGDLHPREALRKEIRAMSTVNHRHITAYLGHKEDPLALCLEYAHGGSLDRHRDLSSDEIKQVMTQLLSALVYLHGQHMSHRDIKTNNVLVRYRGSGAIEVMFGDFGNLSNDERFRTHCGSPLYQAPELHRRSHRSYTNAIDIWSLGVVSLEISDQLPRWRTVYETDRLRWCNMLVDRSQHLEQALPVVRMMLVVDPENRGSAQQCLEYHEPWTTADWYDDRPQAAASYTVLETVETSTGPWTGSGSSSSHGQEDQRADRSLAPSVSTRPPGTLTSYHRWTGF